jgi:hypothetical protein
VGGPGGGGGVGAAVEGGIEAGAEEKAEDGSDLRNAVFEVESVRHRAVGGEVLHFGKWEMRGLLRDGWD